MNLRFITRLPWFELSLVLVILLIGWAVFGVLELEPVDRLDFEGVEQAAKDWHAKESENFRNWQSTGSTNFLREYQKIQEAISYVHSGFTNELEGLEKSQRTNDWTQPGDYRIHEEYLSIATNMEFSVRSMHSKLTNYAGRRGSPDFARADYGDFQRSSRDLKNWIAKQKDRPDADWFRARSLELKARINRLPTSGDYALTGIAYDLGSLLHEIDRIHTKYLADARTLTNNVSEKLFMLRLDSAGREAEDLIKLAHQAHSDGDLILAFLDPQWKSEVRQRTENLKLALVIGKTRFEDLAILHTNTPTPTITDMPIGTVIDKALAGRPKFSAYSAALYPLLIAQIGLGVFLLVALYRRLVVERLRVKLYESNAENKLAHLGQFAAWLAHEIRQPLTAINVRLWTLEKHVTEDTPEHMAISAIRKMLDRLDQVVKSFIRFTHPAVPKLVPLKPEPVLREIQELMKPQLESKGIQFNLDCHIEALFSADPHQLKEVLINLVTNAAESIEKNEGTITLRARKDKARLNGRPVEVILIEVEDTGSGIPPEVQPRLFDPLFGTKEKGTGLGLSIARKIIDAHGGRLEFETVPGEGTTFRIALPMVRDGR